MRITSGTLKGRTIEAPPGDSTRPTAERARQALFTWLEQSTLLEHGLRDARVLDLYAGSGALGLEALSRGARHVTFHEHDPGALSCLRRNLTTLGVASRATVVAGPLPATLAARPAAATDAQGATVRDVDLILCDPPWALRPFNELAAALARSGATTHRTIWVIEHEAPRLPALPPGWRPIWTRAWGRVAVTILRPIVQSA